MKKKPGFAKRIAGALFVVIALGGFSCKNLSPAMQAKLASLHAEHTALPENTEAEKCFKQGIKESFEACLKEAKDDTSAQWCIDLLPKWKMNLEPCCNCTVGDCTPCWG